MEQNYFEGIFQDVSREKHFPDTLTFSRFIKTLTFIASVQGIEIVE